MAGLHADDVRHRRRDAQLKDRAFKLVDAVLLLAIDADDVQDVPLDSMLGDALEARRPHALFPEPRAVAELHTTLCRSLTDRPSARRGQLGSDAVTVARAGRKLHDSVLVAHAAAVARVGVHGCLRERAVMPRKVDREPAGRAKPA